MRVCIGARVALTALVGVLAFGAGTARANLELFQGDEDDNGDLVSGPFDFKDVTFGTGLTECPQAGLDGARPQPLDRRHKDQAEQRSDSGDDTRVNQDFACMPQDETAIDQNPNNSRNYV